MIEITIYIAERSVYIRVLACKDMIVPHVYGLAGVWQGSWCGNLQLDAAHSSDSFVKLPGVWPDLCWQHVAFGKDVAGPDAQHWILQSLLVHSSTARSNTDAIWFQLLTITERCKAPLLPTSSVQAFFPVGFAFVFSLRFRASM